MSEKRKVPWGDYLGRDLFEGDQIIHPNGEKGTIFFSENFDCPTDQWRVDYGDRVPSRLCLQINEKGQAVKFIE